MKLGEIAGVQKLRAGVWEARFSVILPDGSEQGHFLKLAREQDPSLRDIRLEVEAAIERIRNAPDPNAYPILPPSVAVAPVIKLTLWVRFRSWLRRVFGH
jgi:hypothetical protein